MVSLYSDSDEWIKSAFNSVLFLRSSSPPDNFAVLRLLKEKDSIMTSVMKMNSHYLIFHIGFVGWDSGF
jgi:hypothetical protein